MYPVIEKGGMKILIGINYLCRDTYQSGYGFEQTNNSGKG